MAQMIPSNTNRMTPGERKLYAIFRDRFPPECVVRYEVLLGYRDKRPDFTIADPNRGICIVEVKDWGADSITRLSPDQVWVRGMGSPAPKPLINPEMKCQGYQADLREQLAGMASLRDEKNHLRITVEYFLAFPNISRGEFISNHFDRHMSPDRILFKDDLEESGLPLWHRYQNALPELPEPLTQQQSQDVTVALDPTIVLPRPVTEEGLITGTQGKVVDTTQAVSLLSLEQEEIAKSLGEGPRLLRGIAGTGKTMILLYRAKLLAANNPATKILVLCWNTALATYMRQTIDGFQFETQGQVVIKHFSEFIRELLQLPYDPFRDGDDDDFRDFNQQLAQRRVAEGEKYDAIYVDEAQDFRSEWIEFLFEKAVRGAEPKEKNLIIAADDAQRIYSRRDFSWDTLNFKFTGRSKVLKTIYRNSARIWIFSAFLLEEKAAYVTAEDRLSFASQGKYEPLVLPCRDMDEQIERTVDLIQNMRGQGFAARNVLVLYRHKVIPWFKYYPLVENLTGRLSQAGIPWDWISQDTEAKRSFNWEADTVKISTVHSAKGMDSPVVIILGVETYQPPRKLEEQEIDEIKLLYVAMTRAREFLAVLYSGKNGLVANLKYCEREYEKYRDAIKQL